MGDAVAEAVAVVVDVVSRAINASYIPMRDEPNSVGAPKKTKKKHANIINMPKSA